MRRGTVAVPVLASSLGFLDTGATVVVLPDLAQDLALTAAQQQSVLGLSLLALGLLVVPSGAIADAIGHAAAGRLGLLVGAAGATLSALAPSPELLLPGRVVMGVAAALYLPSALASVSAAGPRRLRQWTVATTAVALISPVVGALAVEVGGWRALYVGEAVVAAALAAAWPLAGGGERRRITRREQLLLVLGAVTLVALALPLGAVGAGVAALTGTAALLLLSDALRGHTTLRLLIGVQLVTVAAYAAFAAVPYLLSLYLQGARDVPALQVGALLCLDGLLVVLLTARLGRTGRGLAPGLRRVAAGSLACAAGALVAATLVAARPLVGTVLALLLVGLGSALFIAPLTESALEVVDRAKAGLAAGISLAVARLAAAVGLAGVTAVTAAAAAAGARTGVATRPLSPPPGDALLLDAADAGFRASMLVVAALFFVASLAAFATSGAVRDDDGGRTRRTAGPSRR